ncbi:Oxidoreductase domain protein [[Clostridium] ultunense Esp]|uniref:Oxidoreductase domain protein n=1 Tax=[Clostridium] ultunense Esp TaxID=1288971 RepID=M1Z3Z7_9FIRM|nr:Gfo/Idh/MocA family oxidoreductase [Schnuerera ultunensis]CCQ97625.1 Oxidoreductase domain protein [[Clostridium] ultunense Esp]SHD75753.1 Oxidoreductase domain protein [[Clostridium] ultunense Esp]
MAKVKLGIIGLGRLGRNHAANIHYKIPNAELTAICSTVQEELDNVKMEMNPNYAILDYMELLNIEELDGVVIASNSAFHCEMICNAAKAGIKNIFCEKPLGMTLEEIDVIKETVEKHQVNIFQIGFNRRFDKSLIKMKEQIDKGFIGKPILIKMVNRDPASMAEYIIKFSPTSGGLVFDMLTHDYDLARWLISSDADIVFGMGGVFVYEGLREVNDIDNCTISIGFKNGVMGLMETSRNCTYGYHVEIEVYGTEGSVRMGTLPNKDRLVSLNKDGASVECVEWFFEFWEPTFEAEIQHFVNCIQNDTQPIVGLIDGYKAVKWAFAAKEAVDKRTVIKMK